MSTSGRRNPLDRLTPVATGGPPNRAAGPSASTVGHGDNADGAAALVASPVPAGTPVKDAVEEPVREPVEEPVQEPEWGISAVPRWLDDAPRPGIGMGSDRAGTDLDAGGDRDADWNLSTDHGPDDGPVRGRRFAMAPPAALALIAVGLIACGIAAFGLFDDPGPAPVVAFETSAGPSARVPSVRVSSVQPSTPTNLVVSVVGLVHRPGLVRLAPGARVADAISSAGGPRQGADTVSLNLAQVLHDGDQILVGFAGGDGRSLRSAVVSANGADTSPSTVPGASSAGTPAPSSGMGTRVNLNTASESELDALPGVGPVTARAILDWRNRNGRFTAVDQLGEIDGIGPARLAKLRDLVTV